MYNAEVLSKFPVVQHFPLGSLFSFERDPNAVPQSQAPPGPPSARPAPSAESGSKAPWAAGSTAAAAPPTGGTAAPWAAARREGGGIASANTSRVPPVTSLPDTSRLPPGPMAPTRAPWANPPESAPNGDIGPAKAPWAK